MPSGETRGQGTDVEERDVRVRRGKREGKRERQVGGGGGKRVERREKGRERARRGRGM